MGGLNMAANIHTGPRADAAARGLTFTREQAAYINHHIRNSTQMLLVGRRRLRDSADGCAVRLKALAETVEDLARIGDDSATAREEKAK